MRFLSIFEVFLFIQKFNNDSFFIQAFCRFFIMSRTLLVE